MKIRNKKYGALCCARWETQTICEWIDYHRSIGFDVVYIYCNDDTPDEMYRILLPYMIGDDPYVRFCFNPIQGHQAQSIKHFYRNYAQEVEWIAVFDADEFLCLKKWQTIGQLVEELGKDADAIYFNWLQFGPGEHITRPKTDVLTTYIHCEGKIDVLTKHITKTSSINYDVLKDVRDNMNHHWFPPFNLRIKNVIGDNLTEYWSNFLAGSREKYFSDNPSRANNIYDTAVLHHYVIKSRDDYVRRVKRGLGGGMLDQSIYGDISANGTIDAHIAGLNKIIDETLAEKWKKLTTVPLSAYMIPPTSYTNLALHKPCLQSSLGPDSRGMEIAIEAAGGVNGEKTGGIGFTTDTEEGPWWQIDLEQKCVVTEIRIYNRMGNDVIEGRFDNAVIEISDDQNNWRMIFDVDGRRVGGIDGNPLILSCEPASKIQYVRIRLKEKNYLHLDEVEVYGYPY